MAADRHPPPRIQKWNDSNQSACDVSFPISIVGDMRSDCLLWVGGKLDTCPVDVPPEEVSSLVGLMLQKDTILRAKFLSPCGKFIYYEKADMLLAEWLHQEAGPFKVCARIGFHAQQLTRWTYPYAETIRKILWMVEDIHKYECGYTIKSTDLSLNNFVMLNGVIKMKGFTIRRRTEKYDIAEDYFKVKRLICNEILRGQSSFSPQNPLSPEVEDFMARLDYPIGQRTFITNHPALWNLEERILMYERFFDDMDFNDVNYSIFSSFDGLAEYFDCHQPINLQGEYNCGNKPQKHLQGSGLWKFLRHFCLQSGEFSLTKDYYTLEEMEEMIHAVFPNLLSHIVHFIVDAPNLSMLPRSSVE